MSNIQIDIFCNYFYVHQIHQQFLVRHRFYFVKNDYLLRKESWLIICAFVPNCATKLNFLSALFIVVLDVKEVHAFDTENTRFFLFFKHQTVTLCNEMLAIFEICWFNKRNSCEDLYTINMSLVFILPSGELGLLHLIKSFSFVLCSIFDWIKNIQRNNLSPRPPPAGVLCVYQQADFVCCTYVTEKSEKYWQILIYFHFSFSFQNQGES